MPVAIYAPQTSCSTPLRLQPKHHLLEPPLVPAELNDQRARRCRLLHYDRQGSLRIDAHHLHHHLGQVMQSQVRFGKEHFPDLGFLIGCRFVLSVSSPGEGTVNLHLQQFDGSVMIQN